MDAHVSLASAFVGTYDLDSISAIWSIGWDIPCEVHVDVIGEVSFLRVVLVIEWGTVPIDMNVDIVNMDIVSEDTSKVEVEVNTLCNSIW